MNQKGIEKWACIMLVAGFLNLSISSGMTGEIGETGLHGAISLAVKPEKDFYRLDEAVSLAVAVANHGSQPVYIPVCEPQVFAPYFWVRDANGVNISGGAIDDPNRPIPAHYYMQREGKMVLVFPVVEVKARGLFLTFIHNALKRFRNQITAGRYYLEGSGFPIIVEPTAVISRQDYPQWLWVPQESAERTLLVKHEPIEVTVVGPAAAEERLKLATNSQTAKRSQPQLFGWPSFVAGALCGIVAVLLSLAMKSRLPGRRRMR
jgi:hypothetical protein